MWHFSPFFAREAFHRTKPHLPACSVRRIVCSPGHVGAQLETAASSPVKLNTVFRVATQPWPLYRVSYTYDFSGQRQIYIRGIGRVPAKGNLNYICSEDTIQFLDSEAGSVLYVVKLEHPVTLMGAPALSIPDETQFPGESRRGRWGGRGTFPERAFEILNKTFPSGYRAYEKDKAISYLSTYAEVPVADDDPYGSRNSNLIPSQE